MRSCVAHHRFLVEAPANVCTPSHLAAAAQHIADLDPTHYSLTVLEEAECRALGMGLFVGVAQGSDEPLKFIHLTYKPKGEVRHKVSMDYCAYNASSVWA